MLSSHFLLSWLLVSVSLGCRALKMAGILVLNTISYKLYSTFWLYTQDIVPRMITFRAWPACMIIYIYWIQFFMEIWNQTSQPKNFVYSHYLSGLYQLCYSWHSHTVYMVEIILKVLAVGPLKYIRKFWNVLVNKYFWFGIMPLMTKPTIYNVVLGAI